MCTVMLSTGDVARRAAEHEAPRTHLVCHVKLQADPRAPKSCPWTPPGSASGADVHSPNTARHEWPALEGACGWHAGFINYICRGIFFVRHTDKPALFAATGLP